MRPTVFGRTLPAFEVLKRIIPVALKTAKPGTPEFREAIRASDRARNSRQPGRLQFYGNRPLLDDRARIIPTVKDGKYVPAK